METLLQGLPNLQIRKSIRSDDTVDQFHHYVTVYLFVSAGFLIGLKEFVGQPLDCWVDIESFGHFQEHVNTYCWAHHLYRYPNNTDYRTVPYSLDLGDPGLDLDGIGEEGLERLNFYRWVTVIFFVQALMFKLPALLWSVWNEYSGTQIEKMVSLVTESTFTIKEMRQSTFTILAEFLETWLKIHREPNRFMKNFGGKRTRTILRYCMLCVGGNTGNYLSTIYLIVKTVFLINVFLQFIILSAFLGFDFWQYGPSAVASFPMDNEQFTRVGLCHFQLRGEGHWIQCILTINMLLEIIFFVEWVWLLMLLGLTSISLASWTIRILQTQTSVRFINRYLSSISNSGALPKSGSRAKTVDTFVMNYLGNDGVFLLRILATNTNDVATAELIGAIWNRYLQHETESKEP